MPVVVEAPDDQTARTAKRLIGRRTGVSVVVVDNGNGGTGSRNGPEGNRRIRITGSMPGSADELLRLLHAGVWAVIPAKENIVKTQLRDCVDMVRAGTSPLLNAVAGDRGAVDGFIAAIGSAVPAPRRRTSRETPLTERETQILQMISEGMTSANIANRMGFQLQTIKNNVTGILTKTHANSRTHAVAIALANRWISGM